MNQDERQFEDVVKKTTLDDKPNYIHRDMLQQELLAAFAKHQWQQDRQSQIGIWRTIMRNRITKLAAAAAILTIAGIVTVQFFAGTKAYAQAITGLHNAKTMVFTLITQSNDGNGETIKTDIAFKEPGLMRTSTVDGYIAILDVQSGKMISIMPQGAYSLSEIKDLNQLFKKGPSTLKIIEAMKNLPEKADAELDQSNVDGIDCDGYKVTQGDLTSTIWIDAKNGDVVQVEQKYASAPGMNRIIKNIKFDIELNDSLFSLTPPAGFHQMNELKSDGTGETEQTFVEWLRWWTQSNTDETFPPIVSGPEMAKICMDLAKEGKLKQGAWEKTNPQTMFRAMLFVAKLPQESNWRYAGNNVKVNTPNTPIFWYKPAGSDNYRVIYADLTIQELRLDQLPK
jgi:outer membrane lipoprotein-sorting protein